MGHQWAMLLPYETSRRRVNETHSKGKGGHNNGAEINEIENGKYKVS